MPTYYAPVGNAKLELREERADGMAVFCEVDNKYPTTVICRKDSVLLSPIGPDRNFVAFTGVK